LAQSLPEKDSTRMVNPVYLLQEKIGELAGEIDRKLMDWCRHPSRPSLYTFYRNIPKEDINLALTALQEAKETLGNTETGQRVARIYDVTVLRVYQERPDLLDSDLLQYYIDVVAPSYLAHGINPEKIAILPELRSLPTRA